MSGTAGNPIQAVAAGRRYDVHAGVSGRSESFPDRLLGVFSPWHSPTLSELFQVWNTAPRALWQHVRMQPTIRPLGDRDLDVVIDLSLRAWAPVYSSLENVLGESGVYAELHPDWRVDQRRTVESACSDENVTVWVAETGAVVCGFVPARLDRDTSMGEIYLIAVDPAYQRNGIGSALTSFVVDWITQSGIAVAMVETGGDPGHAPARHLYEQAGFVQLPVARYFRTL
jgi:ribosomal protein S18 acetylase RimI-like enzyme